MMMDEEEPGNLVVDEPADFGARDIKEGHWTALAKQNAANPPQYR